MKNLFPDILRSKSFSFFSLVPRVFSSNHHPIISHQKGGQSCCLPRSQKHYVFIVPLYRLFRVGATCLPRTCGAALPQIVVLGLHQLPPQHLCTVLQSWCLRADFLKDWAKPASSSSLPMIAFFYTYAG